MEGGSANDYDYTSGDPVNNFDLDGLRKRRKNDPLPDVFADDCRARGNYDRGVFYSRYCEHYRLAETKRDSRIFYDFWEKGLRYDRKRSNGNVGLSDVAVIGYKATKCIERGVQFGAAGTVLGGQAAASQQLPPAPASLIGGGLGSGVGCAYGVFVWVTG